MEGVSKKEKAFEYFFWGGELHICGKYSTKAEIIPRRLVGFVC